MHNYTTRRFKISSIGILLLTLSACGGDESSAPAEDPNLAGRPVLEPIKNEDKVRIFNVNTNTLEFFDFQLQASDPNNDPLVFSFAEFVPFPSSQNQIQQPSNVSPEGQFIWYPSIPDWDPLRRYYQFNEEFVVSDNTEPVPLQATQKVVFTIVDTAGGKVSMMHCAECHGLDGDGLNATLPDGSDGFNIIAADLPLLDNTIMLDLMSLGNNGVPDMQYLNDILKPQEITDVVNYVNVLRAANLP